MPRKKANSTAAQNPAPKKATPPVKETTAGPVQPPKQTTEPATPKAPAKTKITYLVNTRWCYPSFGGIPMPPNTHFHGFTTVKVKETTAGKGITEKQARSAALKAGAREEGLTIEGISALPAKW